MQSKAKDRSWLAPGAGGDGRGGAGGAGLLDAGGGDEGGDLRAATQVARLSKAAAKVVAAAEACM